MNVLPVLKSTIIVASLSLASCASLESLVNSPGVSLRNVHVENLEMDSQVFLMSFDVTNPNPFPLPINSIDYEVRLDGVPFARGAARSSFSVPAGSDGEFSIRVELDLLKTAPSLLFVVRDGVREDIPYAVAGELGLDLPNFRPVEFSNEGEVRLLAAVY
jgi:LEA14-like dessication related protein